MRAKAGAAEARPSSSSPDAVTYRASISTDTPVHEPPGVSRKLAFSVSAAMDVVDWGEN